MTRIKVHYDLSPHKHHKRKWMPLTLHFLIEMVVVKITNFLEPNSENPSSLGKLVAVTKDLILGLNTAFPPCCVAWYLIDTLRGVDRIHPIRLRASTDIALAIDDFWSGYLPCSKCAQSWFNGDFFRGCT